MPELADQLPHVVLEGMKLLSGWTTAVLEQVGKRIAFLTLQLKFLSNFQAAWKSAKPTDQYLNPQCPPDATAYERVC